MKPTSIVVDGPVCIGNWCPHNYSGGYGGSMTLTEAIKRSINTVAVKLSITIGNGNAKLGRAKIVKNAKAMGLRTPLPDTPSLPIGADEVTVLDHTVAFATFPNLGKAVASHAILDVRTGNGGDVVWRFDRDGPKPRQALPEKVAFDMVFMMNKAAEEGTGRRAMLDGVRIAGKDRHHQQLSRRLVRRLYHAQPGCRRLGRQRRLQFQQSNDRRLPAGDDLARGHDLCPPGHRTQSAAGIRRLRRPRRAHRSPRPRRATPRRRCGRRC